MRHAPWLVWLLLALLVVVPTLQLTAAPGAEHAGARPRSGQTMSSAQWSHTSARVPAVPAAAVPTPILAALGGVVPGGVAVLPAPLAARPFVPPRA
jgi:hypothetical protein